LIILPTTLHFKGERNYLQGGDIYDGLIAALKEGELGELDGPIFLKMARFTRWQIEVHVNEGEATPTSPPNAVGHFRATIAGKLRLGWIMECERPVTDRREFDESRITYNATLSGEQISYAGHGESTPSEIAVALTKHLHNALFPPQGRRWIVTGFDLSRPFEDRDKLAMAVRLAHNMSNRLTKSSVLSGEETLGSLFFSMVER
jgi:hypothetical protein